MLYSSDKILGLFVGTLPVLSIICIDVLLKDVMFLVLVTNYGRIVLMLGSPQIEANFTKWFKLLWIFLTQKLQTQIVIKSEIWNWTQTKIWNWIGPNWIWNWTTPNKNNFSNRLGRILLTRTDYNPYQKLNQKPKHPPLFLTFQCTAHGSKFCGTTGQVDGTVWLQHTCNSLRLFLPVIITCIEKNVHRGAV